MKKPSGDNKDSRGIRLFLIVSIQSPLNIKIDTKTLLRNISQLSKDQSQKRMGFHHGQASHHKNTINIQRGAMGIRQSLRYSSDAALYDFQQFSFLQNSSYCPPLHLRKTIIKDDEICFVPKCGCIAIGIQGWYNNFLSFDFFFLGKY
uniref:Uncharacterized protein n=1 Tax=Glossina austeni TaxID=7395 RepID=A0A1A9VD13_GLOAU